MENITCCSCGIEFGVPEHWLNKRRENGTGFWCPNGHSLSYTESTNDKLRRERDRLKQQMAYKDDALKQARDSRDYQERRAAAIKGHLTRVKKRVSAGTCPCCRRNFENLQMHMTTKHPDYAQSDDTELKVIDGGVS